MGFAYTSKAAATVAPSVPPGYPPGWAPPAPPTPGPPGPYPPGYPKKPVATGDKLVVTIDPDLLHGPDGASVTVACKTAANANTNSYLGQILQLVCVDADNMPVDMRLSEGDSYESVLTVPVSFMDPEYGWTGTVYFDTSANGTYTMLASVMAVAPTVGGAADWTDANAAALPTITPTEGAYNGVQSFTVTSPDGGQVTVTDDGTDPLTSGTARLEDSPYTFTHSVPCTIKAFSVVAGKVDSGVKTWDYTAVGTGVWTITERKQYTIAGGWQAGFPAYMSDNNTPGDGYVMTATGSNNYGDSASVTMRYYLPAGTNYACTIGPLAVSPDKSISIKLTRYNAAGAEITGRYNPNLNNGTSWLLPVSGVEAFAAGDYLEAVIQYASSNNTLANGNTLALTSMAVTIT